MKVMTTGTFDILHKGHINLLKRSKELGDYLIVGLNVSPENKQPYYDYEDRKLMLDSIKYVDEVVPIYKQEDKFKYLKDVDIFTIGSDYKGYKDMALIEQYCKVVYLERTPDICTTKIKNDLKDEYRTIVCDIDDTILYTINRDFENSIPIQQVIDKLNQLHDMGYKIVLSTARGQKSCNTEEERIAKYYELTANWLKKHNVHFDELQFNKSNGTCYVDDKAITPDAFVKKRFL